MTEQGLRTLDATSIDGSGNIFVGTGNTGTNYNVSDEPRRRSRARAEGALPHRRRHPADRARHADGTAHYLVPVGTQVIDPAHDVIAAAGNRAAWSFDFSVDTDTTGGSGKTLADYNFTITISDGEGHSQIYRPACTSGRGNTPWQLRGGPATDRLLPTRTARRIRRCRRTRSTSGSTSCRLRSATTCAGKHFDIQLTATDAVTGALVASTHDQLVVDTPPVATPNVASVTEDIDAGGATGNVITGRAGRQRRQRQSAHGVRR